MRTPAKIIFWLVTLTVAVGILLGACGASPEPAKESGTTDLGGDYAHEVQIDLSDGRTVTCLNIGATRTHSPVLDCDWDHAR